MNALISVWQFRLSVNEELDALLSKLELCCKLMHSKQCDTCS